MSQKNNNRVALVFGVTGQDGSYLGELLLNKGYRVIGVARRVSVDTTERIKHLFNNPNFEMEVGDVTDAPLVTRMIAQYKPEEVYNLSAQSHVGVSFSNPSSTLDINTRGVLNILEAIRFHSPSSRFYQASTSEMFGSNYTPAWSMPEGPVTSNPATSFKVDKFQDEDTPFSPNSPYAVAKLAGHHLVKVYRESYGLHASAGILFNHESERRGNNFVTRKITRYAAALYHFHNIPNRFHTELDILRDRLELSHNEYSPTGFPLLRLGNLDAERDWGHAADYVRAMWLMLQQSEPDDYVIATGETRSVREFLTMALGAVGVYDWEDFIVVDPAFYRPREVEYLKGNPAKAMKKLGWKPEVSFNDLVIRMVRHDIDEFNREQNAIQKKARFEEIPESQSPDEEL